MLGDDALVLNNALRYLTPAGENGFEGLVARLIGSLSGHKAHLAASGSQGGRDMRVGTQIAVECKRYGRTTSLPERELVGELREATRLIPQLDLWVLAASRPIPDQIESALQEEADRLGVAYVSLESTQDSGGDLTALCAAFPQDVLQWFSAERHAEISGALERYSSTADFADVVARLRSTFSSSWIGFDHARRLSHEWLRQKLSNAENCREAFGQHLATRPEAVHRQQLLKDLTSWFAKDVETRKPLVVLGEEGDGKTWLVADWLDQSAGNADFPLVLFLAAFHATSTTALELLCSALARISPGIQPQKWEDRLNRWTAPLGDELREIVLVLDGVNEKFGVAHWRAVFASLETSPWSRHVRVIVTCRERHWKRELSGAFARGCELLPVPPFSFAELDAALEKRNLTRGALNPSIIPLIRKPRYFDLVVRHRDQLAASGDFTVARLLYEDWRDRFDRRTRTPISQEDFGELLKRLAARALDGERRLTPTQLAGEFPVLGETGRSELYAELASSGVVSNVAAGRVEVASDRLELGLGLLLVDQLQENANSHATASEVIGQWLEPHASIDGKARLVEHAVLHSLMLEGCDQSIRIALLQAWIGLQNRNDPEGRSFIGYMPLDAEAYFKLAPYLWSTPADSPWGQQLLMEAIVRWKEDPRVLALAVEYAVVWMGHIDRHETPQGPSQLRHSSGDFYAQMRTTMEANLGPYKPVGTLQVGRFRLTFVENEGLVGLARFALAYASMMPREPFALAFANCVLADDVDPHFSKRGLISWVLRSARDSTAFRPLVVEMARELARIVDLPVALGAAHKLLRCEGSEESAIESERLTPEPPSDWDRRIEQHEKDPCVSYFALNREECLQCLERADTNIARTAVRSRAFLADPNFPISPHVRARIGQLLDAIEASALWQGRQTTPRESSFEQSRPALLACVPQAFGERIRATFSGINERSPEGIAGLSLYVDNYALLFERETLDRLRICWEHLEDGTSHELRQIEWTLFNAILPLWSAGEQLQQLLARSTEAIDLRSFAFGFDQASTELCDTAGLPDDETSQRRAAWFFSWSPGWVRSRRFEHFLNHSESFVRGTALRALSQFGSDEAKCAWASMGWFNQLGMHDDESYWGSRVLIDCEDVPSADVAARVHPTYLFALGESRDWREDAARAVATHLRVWFKNISATVGLERVDELPPMVIEPDMSAPPGDRPKWQVRDVPQDDSTHFISASSLWGGLFARGELPKDLTHHEAADEWERRAEGRHDAVDKAKRGGALWLDCSVAKRSICKWFDADNDIALELQNLLQQRTKSVDRIIVDAYGLVIAICGHFLDIDPELGTRLYLRIKERQSLVRHVDSGTNLEWIDEMLFDAPQSAPVIELWDEWLRGCSSDAELLTLSLLAGRGDAKEWLLSQVKELLRSSVPVDIARGVILASFTGTDIPTFPEKTWLYDVAARARRYCQQNDWSQAWFRKFANVLSDDEAFAAWGLFLECVDRRFWRWKDAVLSETQVGLPPRRASFLAQNVSELQKAIDKNEKTMRETYLNTKVEEEQAWPWIRMFS